MQVRLITATLSHTFPSEMKGGVMATKKAAATRERLSSRTGSPGTGSRGAANQRADALRNRAKILAGAVTAIRKNPDASVADIAAEAGVGRQTLYGHFRTRPELIDAALLESLERAEDVLSEISLDGDARDAFQRLVASKIGRASCRKARRSRQRGSSRNGN